MSVLLLGVNAHVLMFLIPKRKFIGGNVTEFWLESLSLYAGRKMHAILYRRCHPGNDPNSSYIYISDLLNSCDKHIFETQNGNGSDLNPPYLSIPL